MEVGPPLFNCYNTLSEDGSSSDDELKQINRELSSTKLISQLNSQSPGRTTGGNRVLLGWLCHWFVYIISNLIGLFSFLWQPVNFFSYIGNISVLGQSTLTV